MTAEEGLHEFLVRMPKVELHVHLEGSIHPRLLLQLAERRGVDLPAKDLAGLERWFQFRDFGHFVEIYLTCSRCLRDPEDFQRVARDFVKQQARQNVRCAEVHLTIGTHLANGANGEEIADALAEVIDEAERNSGFMMSWITDIVRDVGPKRADATLEWALNARDRGVVALGLSGFEHQPNEPYREHFAVAAREGLHRVAHAGEHRGPETIHSALDICGAERIGHGIRATEDPELINRLRESGICLEVCPTSNLRLGAVKRFEDHPFDGLRAAGLTVTVNSDDPGFFDASLTGEYQLLAETFGYGAEELAGYSLMALRSSFLSPGRKEWLEREFRADFVRLGQEHLGRDVVPVIPGDGADDIR